MRQRVPSAALALGAVGTAILLAFTPFTSAVVTLAATALFMGGAGHPLSIPQDTPEYIGAYVAGADTTYVAPSGLCVGGDPGCARVAVYTPEQVKLDTGLWDLTYDESIAVGRANLDACLRGIPCTVTEPPFTTTGPPRSLTDHSLVVYGYSQSATIASIEKSDLIAHPPTGTSVSLVLIGNPNRPNGGIFERFAGAYLPIIGITFNGATQTNSPRPTPLTTVDVASQYDPAADFPINPLNPLADLNVAFGFLYFHPENAYFDPGTPLLQGQYRDTTYYLAPAKTLPMLLPLRQIPIIGPTLAAVLDPPLRVLVETGYDRSINPGQPTPAKYLYAPGPIKTVRDFLTAIPTGWDDGIAQLTGDPTNRPFHTTPQSTYGVGGPPVDTGAVDPYGPPTPAPSVQISAAVASVTTTSVDRRKPAAATDRSRSTNTIAAQPDLNASHNPNDDAPGPEATPAPALHSVAGPDAPKAAHSDPSAESPPEATRNHDATPKDGAEAGEHAAA
ncbi:PE-PPE domain-containing protein [Mycolicibacterium sp. 050158]|uniref:PE-PPE domain-containing protein n=1 Tax=Mycolicibacterium sp. 050158 TaxID=3090602 RepID=UPI00299E52B8|nr:PE-PPE domain-containing protein [Mycolicibacterium sp. 050158]MDX1891199.1 PE-PPE domain-containing protein [Mycolicibacterium sp. 050158]